MMTVSPVAMKFQRFCASALFCIGLVGIVVSDFSPKSAEEDRVVNCILRRNEDNLRIVRKCERVFRFSKTTNQRLKRLRCSPVKGKGRTFSTDSFTPDAANDYMCALNDYQNTHGSRLDVLKAVASLGTCAHLYKSIWRTWHQFLGVRQYATIQLAPNSQERNGTRITATLSATGYYGAKYAREDVVAADIVLSRSLDESVEYFGKYRVRASSGLWHDGVLLHETTPIHESIQATCPSNHRRYFVVGINEIGMEDVSSWLTEGNKSLTIVAESTPQRQVLRGPDGSFVEKMLEENLVDGISAIVLHVRQSRSNLRQLLRPSNGQLPANPEPHREQRDLREMVHHSDNPPSAPRPDGHCRRVKFIKNFADNERVLKPGYFDLGECLGSCDEISNWSGQNWKMALNATSHAVVMKTEELWGDESSHSTEPTVCCTPISYKRFHYVTVDERGLTSKYEENMVTEYCGCR